MNFLETIQYLFLFQDSERMKLAIQTWQISATQSFANGLCRYATPWVVFLMRLTALVSKRLLTAMFLDFFHLQYSNHHLIYRWFQKKKNFPGTTSILPASLCQHGSSKRSREPPNRRRRASRVQPSLPSFFLTFTLNLLGQVEDLFHEFHPQKPISCD